MKRALTTNNLLRYRKQVGLTQAEVAKHLGFKSTDRISRWEKGTMYPHVLNFLKIIELYGINAENIYENTEGT